MADEKKEWISALADGELAEAELAKALDVLRSDRELQVSWSRYHLIRDTLHSNLESHVNVDLHARISAALESEPVILAPQRQHHQHRPWLRHAAGFAVAASVTGIAVFGFQHMNQEPGVQPATMAEVVQPENFVRMQPPVTVAAEQEKRDRFEPYLVEHHEYSVSSGVNGMVPYVRIVGHRNAE